MRNYIIITIILLLILTQTGCSNKKPVTRAPRLPQSQEDVRSALKDVIKGNAKLINTINGENKNPIRLVDFDGDGEEEVVVSYSIEENSMPLRVLVLEWDNNGKLKVVDEIKGMGYGIDRIDFKDITGNGKKEIIVGWQLSDWTNKGIGVYHYGDTGFEEVFVESYGELSLYDFDGDGKTELILFKINRDDITAKAELYKFKDGKVVLLGQTPMDYVNGYIKISPGRVAQDKIGVYVDSGVGAHSGFTELLVYEDGRFKNVFHDLEEIDESISDMALQPYVTISEDIDNDGIIEMSCLKEFMGYEDKPMASKQMFTIWYKWDGDRKFKEVMRTYEDNLDGFRFVFPENWDDRISIDVNEKTGIRKTSFSFMANENSKKRPLFSIYSFDIDRWRSLEKERKSNFKEILQYLNKIYVVELYNEDKDLDDWFLKTDEIKQRFSIFDAY